MDTRNPKPQSAADDGNVMLALILCPLAMLDLGLMLAVTHELTRGAQ